MQLLQGKSLNGFLTVPSDKSISHRALLFGALAHGETTIQHFLRAEDCLATMQALRQLGVSIVDDGSIVTVHGKGSEAFLSPNAPLDVQNAGTAFRLLLGVLATQETPITLTGDQSLQKRPMMRVLAPLQQMGVHIEAICDDNYPPLTIRGTRALKPLTYDMPIASAQVKSALLFAALQTDGETVITEKVCSRNHTEEMIRQFGGEITVNDREIRLRGPQRLTGQNVIVPGDISSAAFFIVAGLITPDSAITLKNVGINPTRTGILTVCEQMGAQVKMNKFNEYSADLTIQTSALHATTIGGTLIPQLIDEIPVIALLATQAHGTTIIKDAEELKVKESNRIDTVATELKKLGADITPTEDGLIIHGPTPLHGGIVDSHGDHRIGMMLQIAALIAEGVVTLANAEAVAVSYPTFFQDIQTLARDST